MRNADELARQPREVDRLQNEGEDEPVPSARGTKWKSDIGVIEVAREVLERSVIRGDVAEPKDTDAGPHPQLRDDLIRAA